MDPRAAMGDVVWSWMVYGSRVCGTSCRRTIDRVRTRFGFIRSDARAAFGA